MAPLAQTLALLAMAMATTAVNVIPLDMAPDSFDDQYRGCGPAMTAALPALNRSEFEQNKKFADLWKEAAARWQIHREPKSPLSPDQATAIMALSFDGLDSIFNNAMHMVGHSSQEYRELFHFKTLHFLLTQALVTLQDTQGLQCRNVHWAVHGVQYKAKPGDIVRLGRFTSGSQDRDITMSYGDVTVFEVHTCHSVETLELFDYPSYNDVLIPPFETFKVIKVSQKGGETNIQLLSTGTFSNYNCEWLKGGSVPRAPSHVGGLLLATTALAVAAGIL